MNEEAAESSGGMNIEPHSPEPTSVTDLPPNTSQLKDTQDSVYGADQIRVLEGL